ncbi:AraC family transcriptional regulator [Saccharopolyspora rhizosphaerae]|uniref:AraC family transcriptional regulator n=1 Tax=Saccharopolyspora rhizosphaerae TaxID=2492662 RepID=A0A3R8QK75_9PSEU|nr:AraC family transcriptional regulator [Saccharopolyspora rhizosphaerae]RRO14255.1 AraC family transcriptional regulator [Saccharopolyspora rhizosphaerae]
MATATTEGAVRRAATRDWSEAIRAVTGAYFPHELHPLSPADRLDLAMHTVDLGPVTVGRIGWGVDVAIDCAYPDAYEVNMPLSGCLESRHGRDQVVSGEGTGTIFPPNRTTPITRWSSECTVVGVKFDRACLEREADRVLAAPLPGRLELPAQIDRRSAATRGWLHFVRTLTADLGETHAMLADDGLKQQLASTIMTGFLLATHPDRHSAAPARPRIVNRVLDRLREDPAHAWTATEMAEIAGVSVRRLQEGFQQYVGATPSACLRDIRLTRAHDDLVAARAATVAEVAARWSFSNTGRFAAAYRAKYGCSPSEALQQQPSRAR